MRRRRKRSEGENVSESPWEAGAVREKGLINVTPFWVILMANVKDPELTGG